ncbi:MAG: SDR family NAD(P)-dependent oxidoreductase [Acidimicrobiales bacterium]
MHTTSAAGLFGNFGQANYAAAKMGLVGLSSVIAIEGAKAGITSNVIAPLAKTRLTEELMGPMADAVLPEQVSGLVTFLASEQCELTHEVFSVGGGRIARLRRARPGLAGRQGLCADARGRRRAPRRHPRHGRLHRPRAGDRRDDAAGVHLLRVTPTGSDA